MSDQNEPAAPHLEVEDLISLIQDDDAENAAQSAGDPLPSEIGNYHIIKELGRGAMGAVYEAEHKLLHKRFALKVLSPDRIPDKKTIERFRQEASAVSELDQRSLLRIYEFGIADNWMPFLVTDLFAGEPLSSLLQRHCDKDNLLPADIIAQVMVQAAEALSHAHQRGVIHRDIKPSNILVKQEAGTTLPEVKIIDFGIAKRDQRLDANTPALTTTGELLGTPKYMSPEQCQGEKLDLRSDIYSLGCVLYEMVAGRPPFNSDRIVPLMVGHLQEPVPPIQTNDRRRKSLEAIALKCLEKLPEKRYQSMDALVADLNSAAAGVTIKAKRAKKKGLSFVSVWKASAIGLGLLAASVLAAQLAAPHLGTSHLPALKNRTTAEATSAWREQDRLAVSLMNQGKFEQAARVLDKAQSFAVLSNDAREKLRTVRRRQIVAVVLGDHAKQESLARDINTLKQLAGDSSGKQLHQSELAQHALALVPDKPTTEQVGQVRQLIRAALDGAQAHLMEENALKAARLLKPVTQKALVVFGKDDPLYAECAVALSEAHITKSLILEHHGISEEQKRTLTKTLSESAATLSKVHSPLAYKAELLEGFVLSESEPDKSLALAQRLINLPEESLDSRWRLRAKLLEANCWAQKGDFAKACNMYEQLLAPIANLNQVDLPFCAQRFAQMKGRVSPATAASAVQNAAAKLESSAPLAAARLYANLYILNDGDQKLPLYLSKKALELEQEYNNVPTNHLSCDVLKLQARNLCQAGDSAGAEPYVRQLLAVRQLCEQPGSAKIADTRMWLAHILMLKGDSKPARSELSAFLSTVKSKPAKDLPEIGEWLPPVAGRLADENEKALLLSVYAKRLAALEPGTSPYNAAYRLRQYAQLQFHLGDTQGALKTMRAAAARLESKKPFLESDNRLMRGILYDLGAMEGQAGDHSNQAKTYALLQSAQRGDFRPGHHW